MNRLDPVALEVARHRLESVAEEVGTALIRTSYSPNIKDRRDCSAGIYGPDGELIAQAEHIPLHLGLMPSMIKAAVAEVGRDQLRPGDVLITNNPYIGGSHLPDTCLVTPVHDGDELVALVANMAHHVDVGGSTPGSMATDATEIFAEGIRIPPMKLVEGGRLRTDVLQLLMANVRTHDKTRGDLMAQIAANELGARRVRELVTAWGVEGLRQSCLALVDYAERRTRAALAELPDGTGTFTDHLEHTGTKRADIPLTATVRKNGERFEVDLSESAPQVDGAINCSTAVSEACVAYVVKLLTDPTLPSNAGLMRPVTVVTRPGSVVSAQYPAPVANGNTQTAQRIVDVLLGACQQIAADRVPAASSGSMSIVTVGGRHPRTGEYYSYVETYGGGSGAHPRLDGADAVHTHMTNTRNTPCEVIEREYPLLVRSYQIADGTGGAGQHTGGAGLVRELELTEGDAVAVVATARVDRRPWGLAGGEPGESAQVRAVLDGNTIELPAMSKLNLTAGDHVRIQTAGGGGYGTPP